MEKNDCSNKSSDAEKKACLAQSKKNLKRVEHQKHLIEDLKLCREHHGNDDAKRKECVEKVAVVYLELRPKTLDRKAVQQAKKELHKAEKAVIRADASAPPLIAQVQKTLKARRAAIAGQRDGCKLLKERYDRNKCERAVRKQVRTLEAAERLVKRMSRCGTVFADDIKKRERCVKLLGARVESMLKVKRVMQRHIDPRRPKTLEELELVERRVRRRLRNLLKKLVAKRDECNTARCQRLVNKKIRVARRLLKVVHRKFRTRRVCLLKRRKYRQAEFARRAREHSALAKKHKEGEKCESRRCLERVGAEERRLAGLFGESRRRRRRAYSALRCAPIGKLRLSRAEFAAMRKQERLRGRYSRRARLSAKLARAYRKAARCLTRACHKRWDGIISKLEGDYALLSRKEELHKGQLRHSRRVRLHRALAQLYRKASMCADHNCIKRISRRLRRVKAALKKRKLNFLGQGKDEEDKSVAEATSKAEKFDASEEAEANAWLLSLDVKKKQKKTKGPSFKKARVVASTGDDDDDGDSVDSWLSDSANKKKKADKKKSDKKEKVDRKKKKKKSEDKDIDIDKELADLKKDGDKLMKHVNAAVYSTKKDKTESATTRASIATTKAIKSTKKPVPDSFDWYQAMDESEKKNARDSLKATTRAPIKDPIAAIGQLLFRPVADVAVKPATLKAELTPAPEKTKGSTTAKKVSATTTTTKAGVTAAPVEDETETWIHSEKMLKHGGDPEDHEDEDDKKEEKSRVLGPQDALLKHLLARNGARKPQQSSTKAPAAPKDDKNDIQLSSISLEDLAGYGV